MDKQKEEYIKLRLKLAKEKIKAAEVLLQNRSYRDVVSRAYYSVYYAAKAFLLYQGQDPYSHKGVAILFHKFCASHKRPDTKFAKILSTMHEARLDADYKERALIGERDAEEAIEMARFFLKEIKSLIKTVY